MTRLGTLIGRLLSRLPLRERGEAGRASGRPDGALGDVEDEDPGLFLFDGVPDAIAAEKTLVAEGYRVKLVAPPHHLRAGCDLAVALPRVEHVGARRVLDRERIHTTGWVDDAEGGCSVTDVVTAEDFGDWIMVRAGNMKITVDKRSRRIVNTSGGGCPDIPYLNLELVGLSLDEAPRPRDVGHTLCGLMLDRAFLEIGERVPARSLVSTGAEEGARAS